MLNFRSICLALSSCLRTDEARTVSIEQMKVEPNNELKFFIKDWIMSVEKMEVRHITTKNALSCSG